MPLVIGLDIGTTTITAIAVDETGAVRASRTTPNDAEITSAADKAQGYCEWNAERISEIAFQVLRDLSEEVGEADAVAGLAVTGQQHGGLIVDLETGSFGPLINWQDRRAHDQFPGSSRSFLGEAIARLGEDVPTRCGCRLSAGFLATTLFWRGQRESFSPMHRACFISDLVASIMGSELPTTDPTLAASAGVWDLVADQWDESAIERLSLPLSLFPEVLPCGAELGQLTAEGASDTGLPEGLPIVVGLGDHQASFLGAVADPANSLFINVGTGGQVAAFIDEFQYDPALETRPFPGGGFELVSAGLTGGKAYAALEAFFRISVRELTVENPAAKPLPQPLPQPLPEAVRRENLISPPRFGEGLGEGFFAQLNSLAARVPPGCDGLRCEPYFAGTRLDPNRTATWTGMTEWNFTPGHMARAVLEGMARALHEGAQRIEKLLPKPRPILIGAGNGIRENPLFAEILAREFDRPVRVPHHREEAAYGAAIVAAIGAGILPDFASAAKWIRYDG